MIPYLAVIKDSFRAAIKSNTLRVLFGVVTILLLCLMPFGYTEMLTGRVTYREVRNWPDVLDQIHKSQDLDQPNPGKHIWSLLSKPLQNETTGLYQRIEDMRKRIEEGDEEFDEQEMRGHGVQINALCQALHGELDGTLLANEEFYDAQSWGDLEPNEELEDLLSQNAGELTERKLRRRNRLLLEAALPGLVPRSPPLAVRPTYGGRAIGRAEGNTKDAVIEWYRGWIGFMINWPVSMVLVFVAIVATSNIVPRMFEPGSISLLLSKPISRGRLFLSQFAGSCAFMLLVSIYFTVGVWLISAIRLGVWSPTVFLCIPLFTLMFVVYYAVSAYVGILYRNAIVSVVAVILLFFLCWIIGWTKVEYDDSFVDAARFVHIIDTGDMLVAGDDFLTTTNHYTFDETSRLWKDVYVEREFSFSGGGRPIYDPQGDQLLSVVGLGYSPDMRTLSVGRSVDAWERQRGALAPDNTIRLLMEPDGGILAVSRDGFYRLNGDAIVDEAALLGSTVSPVDDRAMPEVPDEPTDDCQDEESAPEDESATEDPAGDGEEEPASDAGTADAEIPSDATSDDNTADDGAVEDPTKPAETDDNAPSDNGTNGNGAAETEGVDEPNFNPGPDEAMLAKLFPFDLVGPDKQPLPTDPPMAVTIDPSNSRIAVYANGRVAVYDRDAERNYIETAQIDLPDGLEKAATLAAAGPVVVVARDDGEVFVLDAKTLDTIDKFSPEKEVSARFAVASESGEWVALLFHNRKLWLYNTREKKLTKANIWSQGDISGAGFSGNRLLVVDRVARVREMELPSLNVTRTFSPKEVPYLSERAMILPGVETNYYTIHRWVITPLYTLLPKPGELGWAVNYLATGEQTDMGIMSQFFQRGESTSDERHQVRNPWRGVRSCTLFVIFMLALSCWQINRMEF